MGACSSKNVADAVAEPKYALSESNPASPEKSVMPHTFDADATAATTTDQPSPSDDGAGVLEKQSSKDDAAGKEQVDELGPLQVFTTFVSNVIESITPRQQAPSASPSFAPAAVLASTTIANERFVPKENILAPAALALAPAPAASYATSGEAVEAETSTVVANAPAPESVVQVV